MVKEYSKVCTLAPKDGFPKGSVGIAQSLYESGLACEEEVWDENNYPVDVVTYMFDELKVLE